MIRCANILNGNGHCQLLTETGKKTASSLFLKTKDGVRKNKKNRLCPDIPERHTVFAVVEQTVQEVVYSMLLDSMRAVHTFTKYKIKTYNCHF